MKILTAIANYGFKNEIYVRRLTSEYKSMDFDIDIVILSNCPKTFAADIEVLIGLPGKDPWTLPFGHKKLFAERLQNYDLFIYSEDDTLIRQKNIDAFLKVTKVLPKNEIAGFLRYEVDSRGNLFYSTVHASYHWAPNSVKSVGKYTFAYFTNQHSACYILTREQLQKAIESGGYLVGPHEEQYDLLCTAATDPYTQCGFTKVICISHIHDFRVHHLSNQYLGKLGLPEKEMNAQVNALLAINGNKKAQLELFPSRTKLNKSRWDKLYYEKCRDDVLAVVPEHSKNALSVGCGWGATEVKLVQRGIRVVGVPLDSIVAESAKSRGIEVLRPDFERAKESLKNEKFDCILFVDVLQHVRDPRKILTEYTELLSEEACVIISVPNFKHIKHFYEILTDRKVRKDRKIFDRTHIHFTTPAVASRWMSQSGLDVIDVKYYINNHFRWLVRASLGLLNGFFASKIVLEGKKRPSVSVGGLAVS